MESLWDFLNSLCENLSSLVDNLESLCDDFYSVCDDFENFCDEFRSFVENFVILLKGVVFGILFWLVWLFDFLLKMIVSKKGIRCSGSFDIEKMI